MGCCNTCESSPYYSIAFAICICSACQNLSVKTKVQISIDQPYLVQLHWCRHVLPDANVMASNKVQMKPLLSLRVEASVCGVHSTDQFPERLKQMSRYGEPTPCSNG